MPKGKDTHTKGICTDIVQSETDVTTSETDSGWKSPCKLKEEVQTIIDIMGPSLSPHFNYNTSSEADNEESTYSNNSKCVLGKCDKISNENYDTEKSKSTDSSCKEEANNMSTCADANTTSVSTALDHITDPRVNFPYIENICSNEYICPPPLMPANICVNSECFCPQIASILHDRGIQPKFDMSCKYQMPQYQQNDIATKSKEEKPCEGPKNLVHWLKGVISPAKTVASDCHCDYYKMNVKKNRSDDCSPPRRVVFDLVDDKCVKQTCSDNLETKSSKNKKNIKNERLQTQSQVSCDRESSKSRKPVEKTTYSDCSGKTRVDVYYFDHGSYNHYETTDSPPLVVTEEVADKTEKYTTRFWAEIFGTLHIGFSFMTSFILQFFRFFLYSILRPLTIGFIQLASDYFFKPFLVTIFNGVLQPTLIFLYNILASIRDLCDPVAEGVGYFLREFAVLIRAFRIVEITSENCKCTSEKCEKRSRKC